MNPAFKLHSSFQVCHSERSEESALCGQPTTAPGGNETVSQRKRRVLSALFSTPSGDHVFLQPVQSP